MRCLFSDVPPYSQHELLELRGRLGTSLSLISDDKTQIYSHSDDSVCFYWKQGKIAKKYATCISSVFLYLDLKFLRNLFPTFSRHVSAFFSPFFSENDRHTLAKLYLSFSGIIAEKIFSENTNVMLNDQYNFQQSSFEIFDISLSAQLIEMCEIETINKKPLN